MECRGWLGHPVKRLQLIQGEGRVLHDFKVRQIIHVQKFEGFLMETRSRSQQFAMMKITK